MIAQKPGPSRFVVPVDRRFAAQHPEHVVRRAVLEDVGIGEIHTSQLMSTLRRCGGVGNPRAPIHPNKRLVTCFERVGQEGFAGRWLSAFNGQLSALRSLRSLPRLKADR